MTIKIKHPGLLTTIQDIGRIGSQKYGVIVSGAMDALSLRIANLLVGNDQSEGALEVTLYGTSILFNDDHLIAITGGDLQPTINGQSAPMWRPIYVKKGSTLKFHTAITGCRAYVSISGGIKVPKLLGSKSTYLKAQLGGYKGRALQSGDVLNCGKITNIGQAFMEQSQVDHVGWSVQYHSWLTFHQKQPIRVLKGSEYERFDDQSKDNFINKPYKITTQADRMGYHLTGEKLSLSEPFELLSETVTYGTIQIPSTGLPIILMADRQTTGGYPKIGQVITADLPKLAQMQPHHVITFNIVTLEEAEQALLKQEQMIEKLTLGIICKAL